MIGKIITISALLAVLTAVFINFGPRNHSHEYAIVPHGKLKTHYHKHDHNHNEVTVVKSGTFAAEAETIVSHEIEIEPENLERIEVALDDVDISNKSSFLNTLTKIREAPELAKAFVVSFKKLKPGQSLKRDKILFLAGKIEDSQMLPLWKDMLYRETPRFEDEEAITMQVHPGLEARLIAVEQMQAIRKLGQIAFSDSEAKKILFSTALGTTPNAIPLVHREQALKVLSESDPNAYLKLMARIDKDDRLYARLKSKI